MDSRENFYCVLRLQLTWSLPFGLTAGGFRGCVLFPRPWVKTAGTITFECCDVRRPNIEYKKMEDKTKTKTKNFTSIVQLPPSS